MNNSNDLPFLLHQFLGVSVEFATNLRMGEPFNEQEFRDVKHMLETVLEEYAPMGSIPNMAVHLFVSLPSSLRGCISPLHSDQDNKHILDAALEIEDLIMSNTYDSRADQEMG